MKDERQEVPKYFLETLSPLAVARRLDHLRHLYVPESDAEARARIKRERPSKTTLFDTAVATRLRELRALCDLANYLHATRPFGS